MFSSLRRTGGFMVIIVFIVYTVMSFIARAEPTGAELVANSMQFNAAVAKSWMGILYLVCVVLWFFGGFIHGIILAGTARPSRTVAAFPIMGIAGMVWVSLAQFTSTVSSQIPDRGADPPDWILAAAIFLPFAVQILDLILPPWPFGELRGKFSL